MRKFAEIYLENRRQFYTALLPRIPNQEIREWLQAAAAPFEADHGILQALESPDTSLPPDDLASSLVLVDWLKKNSYGQIVARTVISVSEALKRSREVEETGIMLFDMLSQVSPGAIAFNMEIVARRKALASILRLEDGLRYHKLKMNLP